MKEFGLNRIATRDINGMRFSYIGRLPSKGVFFYGSLRPRYEARKALYSSALEASLSGFEAVTLGRSETSSIITKAYIETRGTLHAVFKDPLERIPLEDISPLMLTGGSAIFSYREDLSRGLCHRQALEIASSISILAIIAIDSREDRTSLSFLDPIISGNGIVGVLKASLSSSSSRHLALDGAPIIGSFSDLLSFPRVVAYPTEGGEYSVQGQSYGILEFDGRKAN